MSKLVFSEELNEKLRNLDLVADGNKDCVTIYPSKSSLFGFSTEINPNNDFIVGSVFRSGKIFTEQENLDAAVNYLNRNRPELSDPRGQLECLLKDIQAEMLILVK